MFEGPTKKTRSASLIASLTIAILLASCPLSSLSAGSYFERPAGVFYYQPVSSVFGAEATWVNPAGLAFYDASAFQVMFDQRKDGDGADWGAVIVRDNLGIGYRRLDNPVGDDTQEWVWAAGMKLGSTAQLGASYRAYNRATGELNNAHFWNVGMMGGTGKLRWGALFSNLNHHTDGDGDRTKTDQQYSLSYRPLGNQLTLSVDAVIPGGSNLKDAVYNYHLELAHKRGIYLSGMLDSESNFEIGFRINLRKYMVGSKSGFSDNGDHLRSTFFLGATELEQATILPRQGRRLSLGIGGSIGENPPQPVFGRRSTPFVKVILSIYRAAEDPSIREMLLSLRGLSLGVAQAEELREAIGYFKSRGKQITCHLTHANNIGYYVASACDRILVPPVSRVGLVGLRAELTFYAGTLDMIGVKADMIKVGKYKTGAETYANSEASDANREEVNHLLDDLYEQFVGAIAEGRGISSDSVKTLIDMGPLTSVQARDYGLVDGLSYRDRLRDDVLTPMPEVAFRGYVRDTLVNDGWPKAPELAVVVAEGGIEADGGSSNPLDQGVTLSPSGMRRALGQARGDRDVKGIALRVNSPGGLALAGEEIQRQTKLASQKLPFVISMANVAASGGYYISMTEGEVFASNMTITGSIGIYGGKPDLSGLYEKIKLGKELYVRGQNAGMFSLMRSFTDSERERYYDLMTAFYRHFVDLVAEHRQLEIDSVSVLAEGRVWTGREAVSNGLVDRVGGVKSALDFLSDKSRVKDYRVVVYPLKRPWIVLPGRSIFDLAARTIAPGLLGSDDAALSAPVIPEEGIYARLPYDITIE